MTQKRLNLSLVADDADYLDIALGTIGCEIARGAESGDYETENWAASFSVYDDETPDEDLAPAITRAEHLAWAKERAKQELWRDDKTDAEAISNACASISSDLEKHPETSGHIGGQLFFAQILGGLMTTRQQADKFIEGYN